VDTVQLVTLVIALAGLGLGVVNSYVQWQTYRRDKADVKVDIAWGFMGYSMPGGSRRAGPTRVMVTATNVGRLPAGVTWMGLDLADGRRIALEHVEEGQTMTGVLQPGEHVTMWIDKDQLDRSLIEERTRLRGAFASGPAGQRWMTKKLGGIGALGGPARRS
jgi:hypothetical protein